MDEPNDGEEDAALLPGFVKTVILFDEDGQVTEDKAKTRRYALTVTLFDRRLYEEFGIIKPGEQ